MAKSCPCGHNKPLAQCCGRFLSGAQRAKTPEQLMRSRYSAYALGGHGDYLLATWFSATAGAATAAQLSEKSLDWVGLDVLASQQNGDKGAVEFKAYYREPDNTELRTLHEKAVFQRTAGRWLYVGGEISPQKPVQH